MTHSQGKILSPRIDVHAHFLPDFYSAALRAADLSHPDGMPAIPQWSEEIALHMMDGLGIAAAVISISSPGVHFGDEAAAHQLAGKTNQEAARLQRAHPSRFGWFASTSLPNVKAAIGEACQALDEMGADGVVIESNQQGMYLGDASTLDKRVVPHLGCRGRVFRGRSVFPSVRKEDLPFAQTIRRPLATGIGR